ncbi:class A beta-lactamase-related serine hydrolase [Archangium lipolyticum]|uniref:class A beta-lactamase-related serine hydrolase n=1 Tax=Archangium lipolyticum TaxID=2970465 RepID=UPI002149A7C9|nr:class A beta-lactamase-related serine hydrolase [Archangium lipolyticum]
MRPSALCLALLLTTTAAAKPQARNPVSPTRSRSLETELLRAVREVGFERVRDWRHKGERIAHMPNVDVAVIELDAEGKPVAAANVLLSRDYPKGRAVPLDGKTLGTKAVRFTKWDLERWDGKKGWADAPAEDDLVPGRRKAPLRFMAPYPASLFKILIAYRVMKLVDRGELTLDTPYRFMRDTEDKGERPVRDWLEPMIVESNNGATEALVKLLHERGAMEGLNAEYAALGLGTLQVNGTSPVTGRNWQPGSIHMTALDTAKLFLLIEGGPGVLWKTPAGREVKATELSEPSRTFLKGLLADQGYAEGLSSTLVCGDPNARPGLPVAVPARWLAEDGTATVGSTAFKRDTRPCNAVAEVEFLHKTGQTENYGSDAGIVRALPGKEPRHYVIAFLSNLGYRYYDEGVAGTANFEDEENGFPGTVTAIGFTQSIAELGRRIDETMKRRGLVKR